MSDGISVGDAVLNFIGDTTQLDQTFTSLPSKAKAGLAPVQEQIDGVTDGFKEAGVAGTSVLGEEIPEAAELSRKAMSEARGEVRLLGEEFGIRLPRHVANFVAEMPGVGEALSAAFSATAVLFLIQALVQATEKVADFAGAMLIYTAADKAAHVALVAHEQALGKQVDAYKKAKTALDDYGKSQLEISSDKINALNTSIKEQNQIIYDNTQRLGAARLGITQYSEAEQQAFTDAKELAVKTSEALKEQLELQGKIISQQKDDAALKSLKEEISLREKLTNVQITYMEAFKGLSGESAEEARYQASLKALKATAAAEAKYGKDSVDKVKEINAEIELLEVQHSLKMKTEADKAGTDLEKTFANIQKEVGQDTVGALQAVTAGLPPLVAGLLKMRAAAKTAGVTLRTDLVAALNAAEIAKNDFVTTMGTKDVASIHQFDVAIHKAQLSLKHFNEEAKKGKSLILDDKSAMDEFKDSATKGALELEQGVSKGFEDMIDHQGSFGRAMEKATFSMLASMAEQWGAFYVAKGIADIWLNPAAAAEELAGGTALEVLGGVLSGLGSRGGSGGNSASSTQSQSSSVDTGGSTRSTIGITGVQKFALGGLISAPTLAVIGENPGESEAVLPLDNPKTMAKVGQSISNAGGGGGHTFNVHVKGLVSPDTLTKVMSQISNKVGKGQGKLVSSNTFRITKRSA
jgi:hypothetical protein